MLLPFSIRVADDHVFGKKLFIRMTVHVIRVRWSNFVCVLSLLVLRVGYGMLLY